MHFVEILRTNKLNLKKYSDSKKILFYLRVTGFNKPVNYPPAKAGLQMSRSSFTAQSLPFSTSQHLPHKRILRENLQDTV